MEINELVQRLLLLFFILIFGAGGHRIAYSIAFHLGQMNQRQKDGD